MVYLSTRFLFSAFYLSTRVSYLMADFVDCCSKDVTCSGCWMCEGSRLRDCWDQAQSKIDKCADISDDNLIDKLGCSCTAYSHLSYCWKAGRCCSEFSPTLAGAANLCNLATHPADQITLDLFHKALNDASNARETIYHNDIGTNVPKLKTYIQAQSQDFTESVSHYTRNVTAQTQHSNNYLVNSGSNTGNENSQRKENTNYYDKHGTNYKSKPETNYYGKHGTNYKSKPEANYENKPEANYKSKQGTNYESKSTTRTLEDEKSESKLQSTTPPETQGQHSRGYRPTSNVKSKNDGWPAHPKIHHVAKCSRPQHKCQTQIASQYHKARWDKSSHTHVKHGQSHSQPQSSPATKSELWKRSSVQCGLDFQGVPYPIHIPETVAKEYAKFG